MKIKSKTIDDVMVLELGGKVMGGPDYERFHGEIKDLLGKGHRKFLLDFSRVGWINSTGIGILVGAFQSIANAEGKMKLCALNERALSVFYITQLDKIFETYDSCQEALDAYQGA